MRGSLIATVCAIMLMVAGGILMERHASDGSAITTELLASANSRLFRSGAVWMGFSLGLWSLRPVRMRCLWRLRGSPRLRSSHAYVAPPRLC
jgi:hypothetical protein